MSTKRGRVILVIALVILEMPLLIGLSVFVGVHSLITAIRNAWDTDDWKWWRDEIKSAVRYVYNIHRNFRFVKQHPPEIPKYFYRLENWNRRRAPG